MGYLPFNYQQINIAAGTYKPSAVKAYNNQTFCLWYRALYQRACSTLIIETPEAWKRHKALLYWCLFHYGYVGMGKNNELGAWFNPGSLFGYNFYYEPVKFLLANPYMKITSKTEYDIGTDCEILKLTPDYFGISDVIGYYAEKLASLDVAINTAIINTKFAYIIGAKNKAAAEVMKKLFDKVNSGQPAVFFDAKLAQDPTTKEEPWQALIRDNLKQSYIITDLLRDFSTVINDFDAEVGIPTIPYQKKERMVTSEAESRQIDATSRSIIWYEVLKDSMDICNDFMQFDDGELSVELRYKPDEGGVTDGNGEDDIDRTV